MRGLLVGENVILSTITQDDEAVLLRWFEDVEFLRHYDVVPSVPHNKKDIEDMVSSFNDTVERYLFGIRTKVDNRLVGIIGFDEIVWASGTAFLFIGIGEKELQGRGIGKEAIKLLIDYGFNEFNFHKMQLNVISYNERAIALYERAGFIREGVYREFIFRDGKRYDMYLYGLLKSEWK